MQHHGHDQGGGHGGQQEAAASGRDIQHLPRRLTALLVWTFLTICSYLSAGGRLPAPFGQAPFYTRELACAIILAPTAGPDTPLGEH